MSTPNKEKNFLKIEKVMTTFVNSKFIYVILILAFFMPPVIAKTLCDEDTGFMATGIEAAKIIKEALLANCQDDPNIDCVKKNTNAIKKVREVCNQCTLDSSKNYCINEAENSISRTLAELIEKKESRERESARNAKIAEENAIRLAADRAAAEKRMAEEANRPACYSNCAEKDLLLPYQSLPISDAEIKKLRIRMSESDALKTLNSKKIILSPYPPTRPDQKVFVCGTGFKSPCDFTVAGEIPYSTVMAFYDGILRSLDFVITHPDDVSGKSKLGYEQRANWVVKSYQKILDAFVEKFGIPSQDKPHYSAPSATSGDSIEVKTYDHENVWIFGSDDIAIDLNKNGAGSPPLNQQININFFDKRWQIEDNKRIEDAKAQKAKQNQENDLKKRKSDL